MIHAAIDARMLHQRNRITLSISVLDLFKTGVGSSRSHTIGPMQAAQDFVRALEARALLAATRRIEVRLYGSLAATGIGHGTDHAVIVGLMVGLTG